MKPERTETRSFNGSQVASSIDEALINISLSALGVRRGRPASITKGIVRMNDGTDREIWLCGINLNNAPQRVRDAIANLELELEAWD